MTAKILFITWDGPQVNYLEALFVPIFRELASRGYTVSVLQFTWGSSEYAAATRSACIEANIQVRTVHVLRSPLSIGPLLTTCWGALHIRRAVRDWHINTLMPRSLMPALATLLSGTARSRLRLVFDADGLAADEKVDFGGLSPSSWTYRILRDIEAQMVRIADCVLVRTETAIPILMARAGPSAAADKFAIISNGVKPGEGLTRAERGRRGADEIQVVYAGSVGSQYRPETMIELAYGLKAFFPNLIFNVFTGDEGTFRNRLQLSNLGNESWIRVRNVSADQLRQELMKCDFGFAFRSPSFSTQAIAPIKVGEYLMAGLPIVGDAVGPHIDKLVASGVYFNSDGQNTREVASWVRDLVSKRREIAELCRALAFSHFSLTSSVDQYAAVFDKISELPCPRSRI